MTSSWATKFSSILITKILKASSSNPLPLLVEDFQPTITYKQGIDNIEVDTLSRYPIQEKEKAGPLNSFSTDLALADCFTALPDMDYPLSFAQIHK